MSEYKDRLLEGMGAANVTVTGLAKELGLSYQAVKKVVDGGTSAFTAANNSKAAKALKINSNWLATGEGAKRQAESAPDLSPGHLQLVMSSINDAPPSGYSQEALALAWLLDKVSDRLDKKMAETEASAVILRYINQPVATPIRKPD